MAFKSPNWTEVPNDFFDFLEEGISEAEIRVTLVMIRHTRGFHRKSTRLSVVKLARLAGLSRNGAKAGAEAAEQRGTFRRVNPEDIKSAEWELCVEGDDLEGGQPVTMQEETGQPVTTHWSASDQSTGQPVTSSTGPKESIKENKKEKDGVDFYLDQLKQQSPKEKAIEDFLVQLEKKFHINEISRSSKNQTSAWKILQDMEQHGRSLDQFMLWLKKSQFNWEGRRFYKDVSRLWSDWPQAFAVEDDAPPIEEGKGFLA